MAVTMQQKALGGVLGAGLLALAVDALFLRAAEPDPDAARADAAESLLIEDDAIPPVPPPPPRPTSSELARRIARAAALHEADPTACAPLMSVRRDPDREPAREASAPAPPPAPEETLEGLELRSVIGGSAGVAVVVDTATGKRIRVHVGERVRGFVLVRVEDMTAVFERAGARRTLRMPRSLATEDGG